MKLSLKIKSWKAIVALAGACHLLLLLFLGIATPFTTIFLYAFLYFVILIAFRVGPLARYAAIVKVNLKILFGLLLLVEFSLLLFFKFVNTYTENSFGIYVSEFQKKKRRKVLELGGMRNVFPEVSGYAPNSSKHFQSADFRFDHNYDLFGFRYMICSIPVTHRKLFFWVTAL